MLLSGSDLYRVLPPFSFLSFFQAQGNPLLDRVETLKAHGLHPVKAVAGTKTKQQPKGFRKKYKVSDRYKDAK